MHYTDEFKQIDTLEKAYFIGLLIADGGVIHQKESGSYRTTLKLKESDKPLLDSLTQVFPFFKMGKPEIHKKKFVSYYIRNCNKQLFLDVANFGVIPRKSYENANKVTLPKLSDSQFFSYLHGLFDGDGTIHQSREGWVRIEVIGKCETLFKEISQRLDILGIKSKVYYRAKRDYWMLRISRKEHVKPVIQWFSKTPICLERKFKPYFTADWDRVPGFDNRGKKYTVWFATTSKP